MTDSLTDLINYEGVCRTAPATPGLLMSDGGDCRTAPATPGLLNIYMKMGTEGGNGVHQCKG